VLISPNEPAATAAFRRRPVGARIATAVVLLFGFGAYGVVFSSDGYAANDAPTAAPAGQETTKDLLTKADAGDPQAQYVLSYLVLVDGMTGVAPAAKDKKQAIALALRYLERAAAAGYAPAEHLLGTAYFSGENVTKDPVRAKELFQKAADAGNPDGENALGQMLHEGLAGARDDRAAVMWFEKAVAQKHTSAMVNLAYMYANGLGVAKDEAKAAELTRVAATAGSVEAQHNLGWMYANGRGVDKNLMEALRWYLRAADKGYAPSQLNAGFIYAKGQAGGDAREQLVKAVKWFALASTSSDKAVGDVAKKAIVYVSQHEAPDIVRDGIGEAKKWVWAH
jgi:TPR repeat protein